MAKVQTPGLPKVANYTKNLAKSIKFSTVDYLKNVAPNAAEFMETNQDVFKETYSVIKNHREAIKSAKRYVKTSRVGQAFEEGKKALFEDLKTGNFYNADRIAQFETRAAGMDDDDWGDSWDGLEEYVSSKRGTDDYDMGSDVSVQATRLLGQGVTTAIDESIKANAEVTYKSADYVGSIIQQQATKFFVQNEKYYGTVNLALGDLQSGMSKMTAMAEGLQTHIENARNYYEKSLAIFQENNAIFKEMAEMQRNLYKIQTPNSKSSSYQDVVTSGGMPDLEEYAKKVMKNVKAQLPSEFSMLFGDDFGKDANMLLAFVGAPLKFIPDFLVKTIIPATIKKTVESFDESLGGIFPTLIAKLNDAKNKDDNPILSLLGKIFGLDVKTKTSINTANYKKDAVPFDGITKKAIVEVIPGHLARIESMLTGDKERIFDYEYGKWTDISDIKSSHEYRKRSTYMSAASDVYEPIKDYIAEVRKADADHALELEKQVEGMFKKIYEDYGNFSLRNRDIDKSDKDNIDWGDTAAEYYGIDEEDFKNIAKILKHKKNRKNTFKYASEVLDSIERNARYLENAEVNGSSLIHLYNNSYVNEDIKAGINPDTNKEYTREERLASMRKGKNFLVNSVDKFNKNIFDYLLGIYSEVSYIRSIGFGGGTPSGGGNGPTPDNGPLSNEDIIKRLSTPWQQKIDADRAAREARNNNRTGGDGTADTDMIITDLLRNQDREEEEEKNKKEKSNKPLSERLMESHTIGEKWRAMKDSFEETLKKPAELVTSIFNKADERLYDLLFGTGENPEEVKDKRGRGVKGTLEYIVLRMEETFDDLRDWFVEHIKEPITEWFKKSKLHDAYLWIKERVQPTIDAVKSKLGYAKDTFTGALGRTYGRIPDFFRQRNAQKYGGYNVNSQSDYLNYIATGGRIEDIADDYFADQYSEVSEERASRVNPRLIRAYNRYVNSTRVANANNPYGVNGNIIRPNANTIQSDDDFESYLAGGGDVVNMAKGGLVTKRGLSVISPGEIVIPAGGKDVQARQEREEKEWLKQVKKMTGVNLGAKFRAAGTATAAPTLEVTETDYDRIRDVTKTVIKEVEPNAPDIVATGLIGGGVSLITSFIGGPLLGIAAGLGVGLAKNSHYIQSKLFGDTLVQDHQNGITYHEGGIIPPKWQKNFKKYFPDMRDFGIAGGIAGLFGPFGIVPGIIIGAGVGFAKKNDKIQDILFGKLNDYTGERDQGGLINKAMRDHLKKAVPNMGVGAIGGILLGPFGLFGNAILGSVVGLITSTETFKNILLGRKDKDGKRHGGLPGLLKDIVNRTIDFGKKNILAPLKDFIPPFIQMVKNSVTSIGDHVKNFLSKMLYTVAGKPIGDFIQHKVLAGTAKWLKRILFIPKELAKGVISAPFRMLGGIGNNIRASQIAKGTAHDMTAQERIDWREKHKVRMGFKRDKTKALDYGIVESFKGEGGTAKMEGLRDQISTYLSVSKKHGAEATRKIVECNKVVSKFFNEETSPIDNTRSLYAVIGYKTIKKLYKAVETGNQKLFIKWLNSVEGEMTVEQVNRLKHLLLGENLDGGRLLAIKNALAIRERGKGINKEALSDISKITGRAIKNEKELRRYMRNLNTELDSRRGKDFEETVGEENLTEADKIINDTLKNQTNGIIDLLSEINERLRNNLSYGTKEEESAADKARRVMNGGASFIYGDNVTKESQEVKGGGFGDYIDAYLNNKEMTYEAAEEDAEKADKAAAGKMSLKQRLATMGKTGIAALIARSRKTKHKNYNFFSSYDEDYLNDASGTMGEGHDVTQSARHDLRIKPKMADQGIKVRLMGFGKELGGAIKEKLGIAKVFMFGKKGVGGVVRKAKDGVFGFLSGIFSSNSIFMKVLKGVFFGATSVALMGHGSELIKKIAPRVKEILAPVLDKIKSIFKGIGTILGEAFPNIFGEDGVVTKVFRKIGEVIEMAVTKPGELIKSALTKIFNFYKDGFVLFKENILDPTMNYIVPKLGALIYNAIHGEYKSVYEYLSASTKSTESVKKQAVDEKGNLLYKDSEGNITTSKYNANGVENEAYTTDISVTTTDYNNEGAFNKIRNGIANKSDIVLEKTATDPVTDRKYKLEVHGSGNNEGYNGSYCIIICESTGDFMRLHHYDETKKAYTRMSFGYYCNQSGAATTSGAIIGGAVGTAIGIGLAAVSGIGITTIPFFTKLGAFLGSAIGYAIYQATDGSYRYEQMLPYGSIAEEDYMFLLRFFGFDADIKGSIDVSYIDNWPTFATSVEYENALKSGDSGTVKLEKERLSANEITKSKTDSEKSLVNDYEQPKGGDKVIFYGIAGVNKDGDRIYGWREAQYDTIKNQFPYFRLMYRSSDGATCYYDTRVEYDNLPIEIQGLYTRKDWIPNTDALLTHNYASNKAPEKKSDKEVASTNRVPTTRTATSSTTTTRSVKTGVLSTTDVNGNKDSVGSVNERAQENIQNGESYTDQTQIYKNGAKSRSGKGHIWQKAIDQKFGNSTIADAGCGPVTATNMLNRLSGGDRTLDDATSLARNYISDTGGTNVEYFDDYFGRNGYSTANVDSKAKIRQMIKSGQPAILLGNSGVDNSKAPFGAGDHYINVYGVDRSGNAIVEDPDLPQARSKYPLSRVINDSKNATFIGKARYYGRARKNRRNLSGRGDDVASQIWAFFKLQNFTDYMCAAILGNWEQESGLQPNNLENKYNGTLGMSDEEYTNYVNTNKAWPTSERNNNYPVGYGLAQWTGGSAGQARKDNFLQFAISYCSSQGKAFNIADFDMQLHFALQEFNSSTYSDFMKYMPTSTSPEQAATYMLGTYEMPAGIRKGLISADSNTTKWQNDKRRANARKWYDKFKGTTGTYTGNPSGVAMSTTGTSETVAEDNSLAGKITNLGTSIFKAAYGTGLYDFLFGSEESSTTASSDGTTTSTGEGYKGTSDPNSKWIWPIPASKNSYITSKFGWRNISYGSKDHKGIDIGNGGSIGGSDILAVAPGKVMKVVNSNSSARGKYVQILHQTSDGSNMYAIYQHNKDNNGITQGQTVKQGQTIGHVGGSGTAEHSYSDHLHFEISPDGQRANAVDPAGFVNSSRTYSGASRSGRGDTMDKVSKNIDYNPFDGKDVIYDRKIQPARNFASNKALENLKKVVVADDGNKYGPPLKSAAGRAREGLSYENFLNAIVNILSTIANNTAALDQILSILASSGVKVDRTAVQNAAASSRSAKARIREIVNEANQAAKSRRSGDTSAFDTGIMDMESTAYLVQVMESIASK